MKKQLQFDDRREAVVVFYNVELDDAGLDAYAFRIYNRIARMTAGSKAGKSEESIPEMAAACGMSERRVSTALVELTRRQMIGKETASGRRTRYVLRDKGEWLPATPAPSARVDEETPAPGAGVAPEDPCTTCRPPMHDVQTTHAPGAGVSYKEEIPKDTEECVSRAREAAPDGWGDLGEADVVEWANACRPDLVTPERYAARAWAGKWPNILGQVRAWKASQAAEARGQQPDAPHNGTPVQASALVRALFIAQGWLIDRGTPAQWDEAGRVEEQLGVYAESSTPALPELVARAGEFYAAQSEKGKPWRLGYLEKDWPQIYRSLNRAEPKGNTYVGTAQPVTDETSDAAWRAEQNQAEQMAEVWFSSLAEPEREKLYQAKRAAILTKKPDAAWLWEPEVWEQTIRAGLLRDFIEQRLEVAV